MQLLASHHPMPSSFWLHGFSVMPYDMGCSFGQLGPATLILCPFPSRAVGDAENPKYPRLCTALLTNNHHISAMMTWLSSQSQNMASQQTLWHQDAHQQPCPARVFCTNPFLFEEIKEDSHCKQQGSQQRSHCWRQGR